MNPSNGNLLDNGNGKGNEGLSEVVVTKDLLKSIDEILQSKLVAVEERLKETMTNEIGKNKQNIEAVIKENTTYAEAMFADDTKLYRTIITEDDTTSLQDDIDSLVDWSAFWQLAFNELKCKCMHIGKGRTSRSYQMNDHVLEMYAYWQR